MIMPKWYEYKIKNQETIINKQNELIADMREKIKKQNKRKLSSQLYCRICGKINKRAVSLGGNFLVCSVCYRCIKGRLKDE